MTTSVVEKKASQKIEKSKFTGNILSWAGINILVFLGTVLTLGIAFPWLVCLKQRYVCAHTYINGRKQYFDGSGIQLIGKFICWLLLTIVTFGIYLFWLGLKVRKWIARHTHYIGVKDGTSDFDGGLLELVGIGIASNFLTVITVGIASFWMHCWKMRFYCSHTIIDGHRLNFNGTGGQYFGKKIVWCILTVITFGIYGLWLALKSKQWTVLHTVMESPETLEFDVESSAAEEAEQIRLEAEKKPTVLLAIQICYNTLRIYPWRLIYPIVFGDSGVIETPIAIIVASLNIVFNIIINPVFLITLGVLAFKCAKSVDNTHLKLLSILTTAMCLIGYIDVLSNFSGLFKGLFG